MREVMWSGDPCGCEHPVLLVHLTDGGWRSGWGPRRRPTSIHVEPSATPGPLCQWSDAFPICLGCGGGYLRPWRIVPPDLPPDPEPGTPVLTVHFGDGAGLRHLQAMRQHLGEHLDDLAGTAVTDWLDTRGLGWTVEPA